MSDPTPADRLRELTAAYRVVRRDDPARLGKIVAVYGENATATRVAVAWGEHADTTPHYVGDVAVDELIADLEPAE